MATCHIESLGNYMSIPLSFRLSVTPISQDLLFFTFFIWNKGSISSKVSGLNVSGKFLLNLKWGKCSIFGSILVLFWVYWVFFLNQSIWFFWNCTWWSVWQNALKRLSWIFWVQNHFWTFLRICSLDFTEMCGIKKWEKVALVHF